MAVPVIFSLAGSVLVGFLVTILFTRTVLRRAPQWNLFDRPTEERKSHSRAMPTGGGIAIAAGVLAGVAVLYNTQVGLPSAMQTLPFWLGASLMLGAGFWDDKYGLGPKSKFLLQFVAAYLLLHAGVHLEISGFSFIDGNGFGGGLYSIPLTILWVIGVTNSVNLIDGLDGLATGVIGIAFLACAALFGVRGNLELLGVGIVMVGVLGGFLWYNFNPASIFMGDSGSLFLGYLVAAYTLQGTLHPDPLLTLLVLPILLGVPVLDTGVAIMRRVVSRRSIFAPDQHHIHHQLVKNGSERRAALFLYLVGAWFGSAALLMGILPVAWGYVLASATVIVALGWAQQLGCLTPVPSSEKKQPVGNRQPPAAEMKPDVSNAPVGGDGFRKRSVRVASPVEEENPETALSQREGEKR